MPVPKKKVQPRRYMAEIKASVQLHSDGLHVAVILPWKKLKRVGVQSKEAQRKYRKGSKKT